MAQRRMLAKKISVSEQVSNLSNEAKIIFTWGIAHTDDAGLLPTGLQTLKARIIPMVEMDLDTFGIQVESIVNQGLWKPVTVDNSNYYYLTGFLENQTLKRDRKPQSIAKSIHTWDDVELLGNQMDPNGILSEVKLSKDNTSEQSSQDIPLVIDLFKEINPSYKKWFGNKTQRSACERMIITHGFDKLKKVIEFLPTSNNRKFAPVITTPLQLEDKFAQLVSFWEKEKTNQQPNI